MIDSIVKFLASGLGLGYMPLAPGTFGTVLGSLLFYALRDQPHTWFLYFVLIVAVGSIFVAHMAESSFGEKDCQKIVIDEVAGVLVCYAFVPFSVFNLVLGFVLFRIFDVAKFPPARQAQDKLSGGLGVVADDLVAGVQGGVILFGLPYLIKWTGVGLSLLNFKF